MCVPRLPSYLLQKQSKDRLVKIMTFEDMADQNLSKYGLVGSPTAVEKMFAPPEVEKQVYFDGDAKEKTKQLFNKYATSSAVTANNLSGASLNSSTITNL